MNATGFIDYWAYNLTYDLEIIYTYGNTETHS